ncbi:MAG TPA: class I SAM-dependent methyltransferase [Chloroflexia bacterium]|nr:class I SAM-dependent methyltransferase [Chloroflexia bacterium]
MDFREFEVMYRAEGRHWWYQGLRAVLFRRAGLLDPASRSWAILDAGCGTGGTLAALRASGHLGAQGFDYNEPALHFCHRRGLHNVRRASITAIPFPDGEFDLVISNDVLCDAGTDNEAVALQELYRVLRPGGRLFLNLPAYPFLRSEHDQATDVDRRYTMRSLRARVTAAGFEQPRLSHWNAVLFPVVLAVRLARKRGKERDKSVARSDIQVPAAPVNRILTTIVKLESRLMDWVTIPFGSSVICLARKPAGSGRTIHE